MNLFLATQHLAAALALSGCISFLRALSILQTLSLAFRLITGAFFTFVGLLVLIQLAVLILREHAVAVSIKLSEVAISVFVLGDDTVSVQIALGKAGAFPGLLAILGICSAC